MTIAYESMRTRFQRQIMKEEYNEEETDNILLRDKGRDKDNAERQ